MCLNKLCKREEEKKSLLGKVLVTTAAVIGFGTLIYLAVKYLFEKYHNGCCALCGDDSDDYSCGCDEDADCDYDCSDDCCTCDGDNADTSADNSCEYANDADENIESENDDEN